MGDNTTSRSASRPTLLMVGQGESMDLALKLALDRHGISVRKVGKDRLTRSVQRAAPDVILLVGDAATEHAEEVLAELSRAPYVAAIPVIVLADEASSTRLRQFRHGAMALVARSPSADRMAKKLNEKVRELCQQFNTATGEMGAATFDELIQLLENDLRSGILSVTPHGPDANPIRFVLGAGRPVTEAVNEFVEKIRPLMEGNEQAIQYQFHSSAGGSVKWIDLHSQSAEAVSRIDNLRALLVDDKPARADLIAHELRSRGATVVVCDTEAHGLMRAEALDPHVALINASGLDGPGFQVVRQIRRHPRLRWASILVTPWSDESADELRPPKVAKLLPRLHPILQTETQIRTKASRSKIFDLRLETTGPFRLLRALTASAQNLHLHVHNDNARVEIDLTEELLIGAKAEIFGEEAEVREGTSALAVFLSLNSGRVHVEARENPARVNLMSPVENALANAFQEGLPENVRTNERGGTEDKLDTLAVDNSIPEVEPPQIESAHSDMVTLRPEHPKRDAAQLENQVKLRSFREAITGESSEDFDDGNSDLTVVGEVAQLAQALDSQKAANQVLPIESDDDFDLDALETSMDFEAAESQSLVNGISTSDEQSDPGIKPAGSLPPAPMPGPGEPISDEDALWSDEPVRPSASTIPFDPTKADPSRRFQPAKIRISAHHRTKQESTNPPAETTTPTEKQPATVSVILGQISIGFASALLIAIMALAIYRRSGVQHDGIDQLLGRFGVALDAQTELLETAADDTPVSPDQTTPPTNAPDGPAASATEAIPEVTRTTETVNGDTDPSTVEDTDTVSEGSNETQDTTTIQATEGDGNPTPPPELQVEVNVEAPMPSEDEMDISAMLRAARRAPTLEEEEELYRNILRLQNNEHHAAIGLARLLMRRDEYDEAISLIEIGVRRRPRRVRYRIMLGDALQASGDPTAAERQWRRVLELDPNNRRARSRLQR